MPKEAASSDCTAVGARRRRPSPSEDHSSSEQPANFVRGDCSAASKLSKTLGSTEKALAYSSAYSRSRGVIESLNGRASADPLRMNNMTAIQGRKLQRPDKALMASDIARALGVAEPHVSVGSSVDSTFLDRIHEALGHTGRTGDDAYRKTETVLQDLGLPYDPFWDTSESKERGGSTVTARAFSRIRAAVTGVPRCFILNTTDAPVGTKWEADHESVYRYDDTVTGRRSLNDAGPDSRVIYYSTSNSSRNKMMFIASARIADISPGWDGPWEAAVDSYVDFEYPVSVSEVEIPGWNRQHAITEIDYETFTAITTAGGLVTWPTGVSAGREVSGVRIARRLSKDFPIAVATPHLEIPDGLPEVPRALVPAVEPDYRESTDGRRVDSPDLPRRRTDPRNDKLAEQRAVELVVRAFGAQGWSIVRDCQSDGVGYDLLVARGDCELHVEVKGIQGSNVAFNMTPKEVWRLETDPRFVVVAVTSVLSPSDPRLHLLTSVDLSGARRVVTGYRLTLPG
jgi:hypothetical protein